ncbi:MAG: ATP-grasp domain-containing protein [Armatimonadetes bacterium]|nr:ATP-grasp domain-containing protein [Armatimonadota bacterium]
MNLAELAGVEILLEPRFGWAGRIRLPDGRFVYFKDTNFDLNPLGATEIARDKDFASFFMDQLGYPVIEGKSFLSKKWMKIIDSDEGIDAGFRYAKKLGFPVIVKPNSGSRGARVAKVFNKREFYYFAKQCVREDSRVFLVQRFISGRDYRVVVLDDEVMSVYQRLPLSVQGDGQSTVRQLLANKQAFFRAIQRDTKVPMGDERIPYVLKRQGLRLNSVLRKGQVIYLLDNANLSLGGDAVDCGDNIHPEFKELCVDLTRKMGLRYCGVDLIVIDGEISDAPRNYVIIEINAAPGIDNYAATGEEQARIVEAMYLQVLMAMQKPL